MEDIKTFFCKPVHKYQGDSQTELYRRTDTGEELPLGEMPVGAMWYAPWYDWEPEEDRGGYKPQLEHVLVVKLPDGHDWIVDSQASNCTMQDDTHQERHHCWVISGPIESLTVGKNGVTCEAGAGSIQSYKHTWDEAAKTTRTEPSWHGFLKNGYLTIN